VATLLAGELTTKLGPAVFHAPSIQPGSDFKHRITEELEHAAVIVAIVGPDWFAPGDKYGKRRIDEDNDWVRREIAYGLAKTDVKVIPFLFGDAAFPDEEDAATLPPDLQGLERRQRFSMGLVDRVPQELVDCVVGLILEARKAARARTDPREAVIRAASIVVVHAFGEGSDSDAAGATRTRELIEALEESMPARWAIQPSVSNHPRDARVLRSELLTCQAGVVLLNRDFMGSAPFARQVQVLAWRRALGMPLVTVLLDGMDETELRRSPLRFLGSSFVVGRVARSRSRSSPPSFAIACRVRSSSASTSSTPIPPRSGCATSRGRCEACRT
jgi:hypothetical protein